MIDAYIAAAGLDAPPDDRADVSPAEPAAVHPENARGTTAIPGLSFLGLLALAASASLVGPAFDAPYLVERMAGIPEIRR